MGFAATQRFVEDLNEVLSTIGEELSGEQEAAAYREIADHLQARDVAWISSVSAHEVELSEQEWAKLTKRVQILATNATRTVDHSLEPNTWWLGQRSIELLSLATWIGMHPVTGADVAHLLVHPRSDGFAEKIQRLAEALGLARADTGDMIQVAPDTAWATFRDAGAGRSVWLHYADTEWLQHPITPAWEAAASAHRFIVLSAGMDGLHAQSLRHIDPYLARAHRLYTGLIRLA
ncbi:hypothetical protein [Actinopolymorpha alba]|uniref:hypothetical protein n=1 Tax=Actinopolymorpha alba TaxID=533267 RepID=UPI000370FFCA|nr:hypothetical protein [Actinopolymorpha alba]